MSHNQQQIQIYQYNLNIISITMKIKFPCKMHIQANNNTITTEVSSSANNKFVFNQEITLQEDPDKQFFQLVVHLTTDKGAKYIGGVIKLLNADLMKSQGERLNIPLIKCLDNDACCELRVDQVSTSRVQARKAVRNGKGLGSEYHPEPRARSPISKFQETGNVGGAKSQFYFPISSNTNTRKNQWDRKSRQMPQLSYIPKRKSPIKVYQGKDTNTMDDQISFQGGLGGASNLLEAEVYKEGYQKLKEKYKKQTEIAKAELNKRIQLENNENNYKLEIMRLKLKTEEQEKSLGEKSAKVTQLQNQLVSLQKKQMDLNYMKEEAINKDHQIKVLEETVKTLQKDNNELKVLNNTRFTSDQEKINHLKDEIYQLKVRFQQRENELTRQLKVRNEQIHKKDQEIIAKNELIERERYSVEDLERASQNKIFEFEKVLQNQRALLNQKINDEKDKRVKVENEKSRLEDKTKELNAELEKSKLHVNKIEYDKKILTQAGESMKSELEEFRIYKQKFTELSREFKFLSDDKSHLQKQLQKTIQSKEVNFAQLTKQHNTQIEYYKKLNKEMEDKNKQQSSRIIELESQLQMTKNQLQKAKRNLASTEKDLTDSRTKQKQLKQSLKAKDEQVLGLQTELSSSGQTFKSTEQATKFQLQKTKQQLQKTKTELQSQRLRTNQLTEHNTTLNNDISKLKMKNQFLEEKSEKEQSNASDRITNLETQLKDSQHHVHNLTNHLATLKQTEKELIQKIKNYDLANISTNQTIEKLKKEIKLLEERHNNSELQNKNKSSDLTQLTLTKQALQKKVQQRDTEITGLKADINKLLGEKNKNQKIIEMLQTDLSKAKQQIAEKTRTIADKQAKEEELREEIKRNKEENTKLQMRHIALKKEYEKFKESLLENINNSFAQLPQIENFAQSTANIGLKRQLNQQSKLNISAVLNRSMDQGGTDIISLILSNTKDAKISLNKLIEQNKQLMRENERLSQDMSSSNKKSMNNEQTLSQQIQQIQEELATVYSAKEQEMIKNEDDVFKLNSRMREKESHIKDLSMHVEELEFTLNNIRLDLEATHEEAVKKESVMKKQIIELKEQIDYQGNQINNLQDHIEKMQEELFTTTTELQTERDNLNKRDFKINELLEFREKLQNEVDDLKRNKKHLLEKISELELILNSEKEMKQKHLSLLEEEERKNKDLKTFIDNLMKQKEGAIKSELDKSEQIINLESNLIEMERERDVYREENEKNKKIIEEMKQAIKKLTKNVKDLEASLGEEKSGSNKLSQKLKEREKELAMKTEQLTKLQQKYKRQTQKTGKQMVELQSQMDEKYTSHLISQKQNNEKILGLEKQVNKLEALCEKQKIEISQYEEFVFAGRQKNEELTEENKKYQEEVLELKRKIEQLDQSNNDVSEEVREKEETLFQLSGKIYNLEMKLDAKEAQKNQKLESLNTQWSLKYDAMCDEYEQRIDLVDKEKQFANQRIQEREAEVRKLLAETKINEADGQNIKRIFQQKIKHLEEDRLSILTQKNNEIQKITEENKENYDRLKEKQTQNRKLSHELDIARATISKLDLKAKESEQKIKSINKVYHAQLQQLKKKEANYKQFKEGLINNIWKAQRQVRKTVQYFVKNLLTVTDEKTTKAVVELTKGLENNVVSAMSIKVDDKEAEKTN